MASTSSPSGARLIAVDGLLRPSRDPEAAVLVLHGGAQRREPAGVSTTQASVVRMIPVARRIARAGRGRLAVHRLLNSRRGWDAEHPPPEDVVWALARLRERYGDLPTGLVGHSLGGRAALVAGALDDGVRAVVALNPWLYPTDDAALEGRSVLIVHGDADRIAPLERAQQVAARLARRTDVRLEVVPGGKHAMLSQAGAFERPAAAFVAEALLDQR